MLSWRILFDHPGDAVYHGESFALKGGDTEWYFQPMENLLNEGKYQNDFRMPGYGWVYFLLRLFLGIPATLNTIVILQMVFSAVSVYFLALIAEKICIKQKAFLLCFFVYSISSFVSLWDAYLLTESFSASAIIMSFYFLVKNNVRGNWAFFFAGMFITWVIFMKPVLLPILPIMLVFIVIPVKNKKWTRIIAFLIPFILAEGLWVARNYSVHGRFIPLQKAIFGAMTIDTYHHDLHEFLHSFGGSTAHWEPGAEKGFFLPQKVPGYTRESKLPAKIYTSEFNLDSLVRIRYLIHEWNAAGDGIKRKEIDRVLKEKLNAYTLSIRNEHPYTYYVGSRLYSLKRFLFYSPTYNLFHQEFRFLTAIKKCIKIFYETLYLLILAVGFIGAARMLWKGYRQKNGTLLCIAFSGLYMAFVFPLVFRMDESRFFVTAYPLFVLYLIYVWVDGSRKPEG